ncbi:rare lipoprotein A [Diaporthe helianthi]|uniref:Rare lipoprotein A n=1 Tax=Diaporthe helianthi TaxID=158607 RepID=A0A2P5I8L5_DIAHE|nr:rare lipoprotein A [Diaporthe helianthi]
MKLQTVLFAISAICSSAAPTTPSDAVLQSKAPVAAMVAVPSSEESDTPSSSSRSTNVLRAAAISGSSTFYGGNLNGGACSFTTMSGIPSGLYGTAYSGSAWNNGAKCGSCLEVTGPNGKIKVMVVDVCHECNEGHLDLFQNGFAKIGSISTGIIPTSHTEVPCGISSPIVLHNKSGTSPYWFSMQVVNSNVPVSKLEVSTDGGKTWQATSRTDYNFFEKSSGFRTSTVDVRVTSKSGGIIKVSKVSVASDSKTTAASNFS